MFWLKQIVLWTILVIALTPFAFILMPLIVVGSIIGVLATFFNRIGKLSFGK